MLSFSQNPDLKGYAFTFTPHFFNTLKFQQNQQYDPLLSFYILDEAEKEVKGLIHFTQLGDTAESQPRGPFGGFEVDPHIDDEVFVRFNEFIDSSLSDLGISKIRIIQRPDILFNEIAFDPVEMLYDLNYRIVNTDISHYVSLEDVSLKDIHPMERRNFRKARAKDYRWKLESISSLPEVYSFIERCREQNQLKVNITFEDLRRSFNRFPQKYRIFSIRYQDYLAAASITVEVSKEVMYNYLPASDKRFNKDSPNVFLLVSLYKYAKSLGYEVLDLGVSSIDGKIQTGLAEFKERMGALICEKKSFEKKLS